MDFTGMSPRRVSSVFVAMGICILLSSPSSVRAESRFELSKCSMIDNDCDDRIVSVIQDELTLNLYVTTQRSLKILREDLTLIKETATPVSESKDQNVLTILRGLEILNCKNDLNGTCELRDLSSLDVILEITGSDIVYPGGGPIVGWIDDDPSEGTLLTTAISTKDIGYVKHPLPLVATRKYASRESWSSSNNGTLELLQDDQFVPSSYLQPSSCLADDIDPLYGFTAGNYRYILKKHTEERSVTQVKLIRLCKNDRTFRSYMELPIQCHHGNHRSIGNKEEFISSVAYYTNGALYVTFSKKIDNQPVTYICQYSIEFINNIFTERRRECLEGKTESTEISWHKFNYCPTTAPPQFNFSRLNDPDYCYNKPYAQPLGGTKPIVQNAMAHLTINEDISAMLVVSPTNRGETVYLLGDRKGNFHKVSADGLEMEITSVGRGILERNGLLLHVDKEQIYVISDTEIVKLPLDIPKTTTVGTTTTIRTPTKKKTVNQYNRYDTNNGQYNNFHENNNNGIYHDYGERNDNRESINVRYRVKSQEHPTFWQRVKAHFHTAWNWFMNI